MFLNTVNRLFQGVEVTHCSWKILTLEMLRSFKWRLKFQISKLVCVKQEFIYYKYIVNQKMKLIFSEFSALYQILSYITYLIFLSPITDQWSVFFYFAYCKKGVWPSSVGMWLAQDCSLSKSKAWFLLSFLVLHYFKETCHSGTVINFSHCNLSFGINMK